MDNLENKPTRWLKCEKHFSKVKTIEDFHIRLSITNGMKLGKRDETLIFLDEIQAYPHIISMLKPLNLENKYRYIASGSMLGIALKSTFVPLGSIIEKKMYPLDFEKFLWANNVGHSAISYLKDSFLNLKLFKMIFTIKCLIFLNATSS